MTTEQGDNRFNKLIESLERFDANVDKLRRIKNFLLKAIKEAWKDSGQTNLINHVNLCVRLPIGAVQRMGVEVSFDRTIPPGRPEWIRMRLIDAAGNEIVEGEITSVTLEFLMMDPSPMIDAAAQFCKGLGCLETFKGKIGRFCLMEYKT